MKSEMEIPQNRDREWKVKWKCLEIEIEKWNFSRILEKFLRIKKSSKFTKLLLQNTTKSYSWTNIFHDKMQSYMHNFTLFSREKEWNLKCFHSFREMKSEIIFPFTHSENEKWNENALRSRSRMKSEMKMPRDRDWEVKCQQNSRETRLSQVTVGITTCLFGDLVWFCLMVISPFWRVIHLYSFVRLCPRFVPNCSLIASEIRTFAIIWQFSVIATTAATNQD